MYCMQAVKKIARTIKEELPGHKILIETRVFPKKSTAELNIFFTGSNPEWIDERWRLGYEFACDWDNDHYDSWTDEMVDLEIAKVLTLIRNEMWRLGLR